MAAILSGAHIFIVEDNVNNRAIMQLLLENSGAKVDFERWGTTTVKRLRQCLPVDLVLLDLMLPNEVTGYHIFDQIAREADLASIPIVAVSAMDPNIAVPKTREKGFRGFIAKPIDFVRFANQVAQVIRGESVWEY